MTWCARRQVTRKAQHIPGHLNVIADKISRQGQTIQTEWSLHPEVFQMDLFATRFNNKLPHFVSPVSNSLTWAVDALSQSWVDLDPNIFPPVAVLGKVVEKLQDIPVQQNHTDCSSVAQHALVLGFLLLTQPFNQTFHWNLLNLNVHAWLLDLLYPRYPGMGIRL